MRIAVVGASNDPSKYGYRIVRHLLEEGHTVFPVNLHEDVILGVPAYKHIKDIGQAIDIVDIVVPPKQTLKIIHQVQKYLPRVWVWVQPGAESDEVVQHLEKHSKDFGRVTYNACIMTSLDAA